MGCDDAVQISDKRFAGADTWATSYVLSETIKQKLGEFDLILCGERATDGDTGQVGPGIASYLKLPPCVDAVTLKGFVYFNDAVGNPEETQLIQDEFFGGMSFGISF